MSVYFSIQFERDGPTFPCKALDEVYTLLIKKKLVSVFRYNDKKTGRQYARMAEEYALSVQEQRDRPLFIMPATSVEGVFVESEAFWIENYMIDEFYNPERRPYIEVLTEENK